MLGVPIERTVAEEGSAFGAALLGGVAGGVFADVHEAVAATVHIKNVVEPDADWVGVYGEQQQRYRALYPALRDLERSTVEGEGRPHRAAARGRVRGSRPTRCRYRRGGRPQSRGRRLPHRPRDAPRRLTDPRWVRFPLVPGHEWSGTIAELGEGVDDLAVGDRVVCEGMIPCNRCRRCKEGETQLCLNYDQIGFTRGGGYGEYVLVPRHVVHRLPDEVSFAAGVLVEPGSCVLRGIERAACARARRSG